MINVITIIAFGCALPGALVLLANYLERRHQMYRAASIFGTSGVVLVIVLAAPIALHYVFPWWLQLVARTVAP